MKNQIMKRRGVMALFGKVILLGFAVGVFGNASLPLYAEEVSSTAELMQGRNAFLVERNERTGETEISFLEKKGDRVAITGFVAKQPEAVEYQCGLAGCICFGYPDCLHLAAAEKCTVEVLPGPAGPLVGFCTPGQ